MQIMECTNMSDLRTIAVDLRGYGDSDKPFGSKHYTLNVVMEDIKDLLDALGIERCILVGHDWGGLIVWQFAQMYPHRLQKFIVINAPERTVFWRYIFTSFDQFKRSWYIFFFQSPYLPEIAFKIDDLKVFENVYRTNEQLAILNAEELEAYKYTFGKTDALTPPLNYYRAIKYEGKSLKHSSNRQSEAVKPPGLLIISDEDRALSRGLLELSAKIFGGDRIAIQLITKAGHFVQQEKPCEVNQAIATFIL
ncbi:epoxide hydrolase 4-like isoform X2 [Rhodnius prolixus]|uniref:epoxide hydrolase 4-like isoform X2 n=1 Tax=Rhodnius prolixus TaxID=13249 RepID=UPI003D18EB4F